MTRLEQEVCVARSPKAVWGVVGDFGNDGRWRRVDEMVADPPGPARAGAKTREVLRFLGSTYVTEATVTDAKPGSLAFEGGGDGTTARGYRRVERTPEGARFVEGLEIGLSGPMRLLEPLLSRLYARRMRSEALALKSLLEG